jgi:yersiniabactin salicyl-AMP ligase
MDQDEHCSWTTEERERFVRLGYWQPRTLGQELQAWAERSQGELAVVDRYERLSYRALDLKANRLAAGFYHLGVRRGDRVLCQLPNGTAFVACFFALLRLGAVPVLAMPAQREDDIDALCRLATPSAYLVAERFLGFDYRPLAQSMARKHRGLVPLILGGPDDPEMRLEALEREAQPFEPPSPDSTALLLLSGGTTGTPKLIARTHADYAYNARAMAEASGLDRRSVYLAALPIAHNFPLACPGLLGTLHAGGRVILARTPSCDEAFGWIARERVTITALVPALLEIWIAAREWDSTDLSSLGTLQVGGSRLDPALARRVEPALGCRLQQVFGMAEGLICCTRADDPPDVIVGTQGRPISPDDEIRIVDASERLVPAGEAGELLTRGPYTIRGYYRAGEYNRERFTADGFYRTGDRVRRTAEGNLVVEGRLKEQINRAGEKIAAVEIEQALAQYPGVKSCVVVAVPDERLGERSCAFVSSDDPALDLASVRSFLRERGLPAYKLPDQLERIAAWPLTAVGKVDKARLVALARPAAPAQPEPVRPAAHKSSYHERWIELQGTPEDVAVLLVQSGVSDTYAIYEHDAEWSVGFEPAALISVQPGTVSLRHAGEEMRWTGLDPCEHLGSALAAVPIAEHRAYGVCTFELAHSLYGSKLQDCDDTLLELFVPEHEVRLTRGSARVRSLDERKLSDLVARVQVCDRDALGQPRPAHVTLDSDRQRELCRDGAAAYTETVRQAVAEIRNKEYLKVILSRRVAIAEPVDLLETYRLGRRHNTPARSFVFKHRHLEMMGFSPETVVRVSASGQVSTQPLAGTRSLGRGDAEEAALRRELVNDTKEIAEHAVSVKLAYEELEPVCVADSVVVSRFMTVSRRGSVQHLASRVEGSLRPGLDCWKAFRALFPAVTASGIPKREALVAIRRHEQEPRGPYSGCVMIADADGALDAALVLRALYRQAGVTWLQAGAGVLDQSQPERELEETVEKLQCISRYVVCAGAAPQAEVEERRA